MAAPTILPIPTILQAYQLGGGYALQDRATKNALFGGIPVQTMPQKITFIGRRVQYRYDTTQIAINAIASITITSVPADDYNIQVFINDPEYGSISLGSYVKDGTDTTNVLLAAHIADTLSANSYGYGVSSSYNSAIITARTDLGSTINGNNLSVIATTTSETKAKAFFGFPSRVSAGTVFTTTVDDPDLGTITLSVYTQQSGDTTDEIFNANFIASLNANIYSYTTTLYLTTGFYIVAPTGYGATINGHDADIVQGFITQSATFLGGVTAIGIIPNYLTQFSGGVSATDDPTLRGNANLLWKLLGKYGIKALNNLDEGGVIVTQTPSISQYLIVQKAYPQFVVGANGSPMNEGDTVLVITDSLAVAETLEGQVTVHVDGGEFGQQLLDRTSYTAVYSTGQYTITFNQGVLNGNLIMIDYPIKKNLVYSSNTPTPIPETLYTVTLNGVGTGTLVDINGNIFPIAAGTQGLLVIELAGQDQDNNGFAGYWQYYVNNIGGAITLVLSNGGIYQPYSEGDIYSAIVISEDDGLGGVKIEATGFTGKTITVNAKFNYSPFSF